MGLGSCPTLSYWEGDMMVVVSFSIGFRNTFNPTPVSLDVGQFLV